MKKIILFILIGFSSLVNGQTQAYLDCNNVKALILNRGDMFWNPSGGAMQYEVPRGSNKHCNFANAIWIGGYDSGNQLHMAGMTYRQTGYDFWPGPLDTLSASITSSVSTSYNRVWKINMSDINNLIIAYNNGWIAANTFTPVADIVNWPANGNVASGYSKGLAPFYDNNGDGYYDYHQGDYPLIKGDQMIWYVINDKLNAHTETSGVPLGIEVQVSAYAYSCTAVLNTYPELASTTFYDYKIYNRSNTTYTNTMLGVWNDGDIGGYTDDYIGCDVGPGRNVGYMYNADQSDAMYGNYPPILSYKIHKGPLADAGDLVDNDNDGATDEAGEECQFNNFMFYNNTGKPQTTNPAITLHYLNYLNSIWKDGAPLRGDSMGYLSVTNTVTPTKFAFPGNVQTSAGWTEYTRNNPPGDRRFTIGNGPFTFQPKSMVEMEFSIQTTFDSTAGGYKNITKAINQNGSISSFYALTTKPSCQLITGLKPFKAEKMEFQLLPNPATNFVSIRSGTQLLGAEVSIYNSIGQIIMRDKIPNTNYALDVSGFTNGIYFVEVKTKDGSAITKLVKN